MPAIDVRELFMHTDRIRTVLKLVEIDGAKFMTGNAAACSRARKYLLEARELCQQLRKNLNDTRRAGEEHQRDEDLSSLVEQTEFQMPDGTVIEGDPEDE